MIDFTGICCLSRDFPADWGRKWRMRSCFSALSAKVCVWKTHLSHFYVLQTTMKFGEVNVFPWSIFYGKQTFPGDASLRACWECVYDSKFEHRRPCRILWLFMLVVLLETFYRRNVNNGESLLPVWNHRLPKNNLMAVVIYIKLNSLTCRNILFYSRGKFQFINIW